MNDKIIVKINNDKIMGLSAVDENGVSSEISNASDIRKLEYQNAIEVLEDKKSKLIETLDLVDGKRKKLFKIVKKACVPIYIGAIISFSTYSQTDLIYSIIHYVTFASSVITFGVANYVMKLEHKSRDILNMKNSVDKDIRDLQKELKKEADKSYNNVLELQISSRVLDKVEEKYLYRNSVYNSIDYDYAKLTKEKEKRPASDDLEYTNYDEKPKRKKLQR